VRSERRIRDDALRERSLREDAMRWASAISEEPDAEGAAESVVAAVRTELGDAAPDVAFLFASEAYGPAYDRLAWHVRRGLPDVLLVGCSARSVIGGGREIEGRAALSLTAARLPGVSVRAMRVAGEGFPRGTDSWREHFEIESSPDPHFVLLADPWTCDAESLVAQLDADFPDSTLVGGLASGADRAGENALFLGDRVHNGGLVGVALQGDVRVDSVVAQGCRPIGQPMFVTRVRDGHVLVEVDGRPPIEVVRALFEDADARDRGLLQSSLFLGIEMRPDLTAYGRGDFLIRNLTGGDPRTGALAIAAPLREGQVVQFHLRDARTSAEDLDERLTRYQADREGYGPPEGALLFSCLGRGAWLYGVPDHDSDAFRRHVGAVPLGGFFCNGEIGPVERRTFLHGYTSAFGLFRPRLA
jgi:small ligand-binding sensory domain FIST